jgi:WD40 repeat protein
VKHEDRIRDAAFTPNGNSLLTVSDDTTAILWPLRSENPESEATVLIGHESAIHAGLLAGDGRWAITGSDDGTVRMWDLLSENPSTSAVILHHFDEPVRALDLMNQTVSSTLAIGTRNGEIFTWPLSPQELIDRVRKSAGRSLTSKENKQFKTTAGGLDETNLRAGKTNSSQSR